MQYLTCLIILSLAILGNAITFTVYTTGDTRNDTRVDWATCTTDYQKSPANTCNTYTDDTYSYGEFFSTYNSCAVNYTATLALMYLGASGSNAPRLTDMIFVDVTTTGIYVEYQSPYTGDQPDTDCNYSTYNNGIYTFACPYYNVYVQSP